MEEQREAKGVIDAQWLATEVASIIYNRGKGKILTVLESQQEPGPKLFAAKKLVEDVLAGISKDAANLICDILSDWQEEVGIGPEADLSAAELEELENEYKEVEEIIK